MSLTECSIFERWLKEVERVGTETSRCSHVDCYLNLDSASPSELVSAQALLCDTCGCDEEQDRTWLVIVLLLQVLAIIAFHRFYNSERKFVHVLSFGLLLRGILLPEFPHCMVALGYLIHLLIPMRGFANFALTVSLDALLPQTDVALALIPVRLYSAILGFERRGNEYKTSPDVDEVREFRKPVHPPVIDHVALEQLDISAVRDKMNLAMYAVALTICVMLCLQIPWTSDGDAPATSCPGEEGLAPCNPWSTVSRSNVKGPAQCCASCDKTPECQGWSYKTHGNSCWLFRYTSCPSGVCEPCQSYPGSFYGAKM